MKNLYYTIILLSFITLSCGEDNPVVPEDDGIRWGQITGNFAYLKGSVLHLIDTKSRSVKSLGLTNLANLKWNNSVSKITGIRCNNDSTYSLEGIDLDGNHSIINNELSTKYYDWLPDGRLVTITDMGKIQIEGTDILNQTFNTVFGLACSPNGKKIVVSTDNILENYLVEIDINSLNQQILERNSNILDPNFDQPVYSLESDKVFYVTYVFTFRFLDPSIHDNSVWSIPKKELESGRDPCRADNLERILYTKVTSVSADIIGIYSVDTDGGDSVELIRGGHTPIWIYQD
jgi:elongation factor P hydroxylase